MKTKIDFSFLPLLSEEEREYLNQVVLVAYLEGKTEASKEALDALITAYK